MHRYFLFATAFIITAYCHAQTTVAPEDKQISYEGRILFRNGAAELIWPATCVRVNFEGTGISGIFRDADTSNYYNVMVDGGPITTFHFTKEKKTWALAENLPAGKHTIAIYKRTEWDKGRTYFYGFELNDGTKLLPPPVLPKRKMEVFGNSITCGYAITDYTSDRSTGYYQSCYDAYAAITARHFNAQIHETAKSGIGIMVSWFPLIMPEMYNRTDPEDSTSRWDFKQYTPDVVLINLFQNDSWIVNQPNNPQFKSRFGDTKPTPEQTIAAYKNFVQTVRSTYPKAQIICMLGNMDITKDGSPWPGYVKEAVAQLHDSKIFTYFAPYKNTPGHPKEAEQKVLADGLIKFMDEHIKW